MNDPFLSEEACIERLVSDAAKHDGKLIIAYDFDNTVYDIHGKGYTFTYVAALLERASKHTLICYTASDDEEFVRGYLMRNKIPFDMINASPVGNGKKLYYNILLDDRAGLDSACRILHNFLEGEKTC